MLNMAREGRGTEAVCAGMFRQGQDESAGTFAAGGDAGGQDATPASFTNGPGQCGRASLTGSGRQDAPMLWMAGLDGFRFFCRDKAGEQEATRPL